MLPAGIVNSGYTQALGTPSVSQVDPGSAVSGSDLSIADVAASQISSGIPVPDSVSIVNQTIRIVPGGGIVVDVEVDVNNSAGADTFEVRLAKL